VSKAILIELFTSPTCPHCPRAKEVAERAVKGLPNALLLERDVTDPENSEIARRYGIKGVPTMIINEKYRVVGAPSSEEELTKYLKEV